MKCPADAPPLFIQEVLGSKLAEGALAESNPVGSSLVENRSGDVDSVERDIAEDWVEGFQAFGEQLPAQLPSPGSLERLLAGVSSLPDQYAPFFEQLENLFDLDEQSIRQQLRRAKDKKAWVASGIPGISTFVVSAGQRVQSSHCLLARFEPGSRIPRHRHHQPERTLILEGGYQNEQGKEFLPGDVEARGTQGVHECRALPGGPCIVASVNQGFQFCFFPLRLAARVFGRWGY